MSTKDVIIRQAKGNTTAPATSFECEGHKKISTIRPLCVHNERMILGDLPIPTVIIDW